MGIAKRLVHDWVASPLWWLSEVGMVVAKALHEATS